MEEIWKDIKGYEGLYQVSNLGRVRNIKQGLILKQTVNEKGYLRIGLSKKDKRKTFRVHRLVTEAFIPNPHNYPYVNHKDENKQNNCVDNLEWCTQKYNINYGTAKERLSETKRNNTYNVKRVIQYTLDGEFVKEWPSLMEIERQFGFSNSAISKCCQGKYHTAYGFKWEHTENNEVNAA